MMMTAEPNSSAGRRIRSRICAWTVTSSAVVGSSAISSSRVVDQRHRDHRALPHAAGELVRVVVDPLAGLRDADPVEHLDRARPGRLLATRLVVDPVGLDDLVADRVVRVHRGQRVLEDHRHLRGRAGARTVLAAGRTSSSPSEPDLAGHPRRAALVQAHAWPGWSRSCPSPTRRRCRGSCPGRAAKDSPSTDLTTPSSVGKCTRRSRTSRKRGGDRSGPSSRTSGTVAKALMPAGPAGRRPRRACPRSGWRAMMNNAATSVTPSTTFGRSLFVIASTAYLPMPGSENVLSVRTAPPSSSPRSRPKMVSIGVSAGAQRVLDDHGPLWRGPWPGRCGCSPRPWSPACRRG